MMNIYSLWEHITDSDGEMIARILVVREVEIMKLTSETFFTVIRRINMGYDDHNLVRLYLDDKGEYCKHADDTPHSHWRLRIFIGHGPPPKPRARWQNVLEFEHVSEDKLIQAMAVRR